MALPYAGLLLVVFGAEGIADLAHGGGDPADDPAHPAHGGAQPAERKEERATAREPLLVDAVEVDDAHLVRTRVQGVGPEHPADEAPPIPDEALAHRGAEADLDLAIASFVVAWAKDGLLGVTG